MSLDSTNFGNRLREERKRLGLTQTAMGAVGGVSKDAQFNYEAGLRSPDSVYLMKAAQSGLDLHFLFTGVRTAPDTLTPEEAALLANFEAADEAGKAIIEGAARLAAGAKPRT